MNEEIIIPRQEEFDSKKKKLVHEGVSHLYLVSDFDGTLNKLYVQGRKVPSIISILRDENYLSKEYSLKAHELYKRYSVIERDSHTSEDVKKEKMLEWWTLHFDLLIRSGLHKKDLEQVITSEKIQLREGVLDFLDYVRNRAVPLVIMSSSALGGDTIRSYLTQKKKIYSTIEVISNTIEWDKKGNAVGIKQPIIHSLNKDEAILKDHPIIRRIWSRKNVLLLGNNVGDVHMIKSFPYETVIKIGFLNDTIEENLHAFRKHYDVVITHDGSFNFLNTLVQEIDDKN